MAGQSVVDLLLEALSNREVTVRKDAVQFLRRLRDGRAMEEMGMARSDIDHEVGRAAAMAFKIFESTAIGI